MRACRPLISAGSPTALNRDGQRPCRMCRPSRQCAAAAQSARRPAWGADRSPGRGPLGRLPRFSRGWEAR
ncbi:hypothetical protein TsocGM_06595 [Tautonia sociabilis]|uniref:Uncharacterized protein n=1 Tax=Tautonia sociabilis TaxID=2080755 RepID=A0A432MN97_9BACT|nr:hypothetical protein TsocGM_06595 [Tautonia sociabilis]